MSFLKNFALGLSGFAASFTLAPASEATSILYTFSNAKYSNASDYAKLSGSFVWDTVASKVTSSTIDLAGLDNGSIVSCTDCRTAIYSPTHFALGNNPAATLYITFGGSLNDGGSIPLSLKAYGAINQPEYQGRNPFTFVSGEAVAAVPEPATWAMMVAGFGALAFAMRRRTAAARLSCAI